MDRGVPQFPLRSLSSRGLLSLPLSLSLSLSLSSQTHQYTTACREPAPLFPGMFSFYFFPNNLP
ncbi:MAG: hypothetical protein N7Q72_04020, partial [Spiroplasma sp. Tabriz.8]|nr:hypothetical protein [Spiroplasma sp. Tabriz.8]